MSDGTESPDITWAELVAGMLEAVRFEQVLDDALVDRIAGAMVHTRMFHAPAADQAAAIDEALRRSVRLTELAPVDREEAEFRDFLRRLRHRLDELAPWPEWRYVQVGRAEWSWSEARPVARLALSPQRLGNGLHLLFERVTRDDHTLELAVLLLADGPMVALARDLADDSLETTVYAAAAEPAGATVAAFLDATGIDAGTVAWQEETVAVTTDNPAWAALEVRLAAAFADLPDGAVVQFRPAAAPLDGWYFQLWREADLACAEMTDPTDTSPLLSRLGHMGWLPFGHDRAASWVLAWTWPVGTPLRAELAEHLVASLCEGFRPAAPDELVHRYWSADGTLGTLPGLGLEPLRVDHFARYEGERPVELLRRVTAGRWVTDESLGADGVWRGTGAIVRAEPGELAELDPGQAGRLLGGWPASSAPEPVERPRWSTMARGEAARPVPAGQPVLNAFERAAVTSYLLRAPVAIATMGLSEDPYQPDRPEVVPLHVHTDGVWVWSESEAYFAEHYGVPPDPELLAHIRRRDYRAPDELATDILMRAAQATP